MTVPWQGKPPDDNPPSVREATRRILGGHKPRGMTIGKDCPGCGQDGVWHYNENEIAKGFKCEVCDTVVPYDPAE